MKLMKWLATAVTLTAFGLSSAMAADKAKQDEVLKASAATMADVLAKEPRLKAKVEKAPGYAVFTTYGLASSRWRRRQGCCARQRDQEDHVHGPGSGERRAATWRQRNPLPVHLQGQGQHAAVHRQGLGCDGDCFRRRRYRHQGREHQLGTFTGGDFYRLTKTGPRSRRGCVGHQGLEGQGPELGRSPSEADSRSKGLGRAGPFFLCATLGRSFERRATSRCRSCRIFIGSDIRSTRPAKRPESLADSSNNRSLTVQYLRRVHRELPQPHPEQQLGHFEIPSQFAADGNRHARLGTDAYRLRDQTQHSGMHLVIQVSHSAVGAVDRQRVLDQVVGADRQELEPLHELRQLTRRPQAPPPCRRAGCGRRT